ncbi:malonic semialdehyde reductase [Planosporangium mesophilum]|uniref:Nitroreductase family protein n=1 Tax=Planosporangium mesophilum TaxID=689768 RepID=A0A8J3TD51_9ACTN|nr:malonic semialdehyde reductase [Planosporangium mesophilum]GII22977.1 nitroreductase family protein [Planosporangium mesophilum]
MTSLMTDSPSPLDLFALPAGARELLFTEARTANTFSDEPVTDAQLEAIHELTKWGPTAANTQPMRILYVRTPEARERLVGHMSDGNKEKTRTAPVVAVVAADLEFHEFVPKVFPIRPEMKDFLAGDPTGRERMARFNAALQAGYYLLAVRAAGLAAGPMTGFDVDGLDREFFPEGRWTSLMVVNIGKPGHNAWFDRLPRLDYDEVTRVV